MDCFAEDLALLADFIRRQDVRHSRIFLTGGTGLLGSLIAKAFLEANRRFGLENTVTLLARSEEKVRAIYGEEQGLQAVYGDIRRLPSLWHCQERSDAASSSSAQGIAVCAPVRNDSGNQYDYIIHTAAPTASAYLVSHPAETLDVIYTGTRNVLELARRANPRSVVCLSSMEVFGVTPPTDRRLAEGELGTVDLTSVRSCYPEGKRVLELLCRIYAEQYGVPVKAARLAQTFGAGILPGEGRAFAQFARSALRGEDIVLHTAGESVGNYVYTRDAVTAILTILLKGENGETYNAANEASTRTVRQLAELAAETLSGGRSRVVFDIPAGNVYGYAPASRARLSAAKLAALGWRPEVDLREAFMRLGNWLEREETHS